MVDLLFFGWVVLLFFVCDCMYVSFGYLSGAVLFVQRAVHRRGRTRRRKRRKRRQRRRRRRRVVVCLSGFGATLYASSRGSYTVLADEKDM